MAQLPRVLPRPRTAASRPVRRYITRHAAPGTPYQRCSPASAPPCPAFSTRPPLRIRPSPARPDGLPSPGATPAIRPRLGRLRRGPTPWTPFLTRSPAPRPLRQAQRPTPPPPWVASMRVPGTNPCSPLTRQRRNTTAVLTAPAWWSPSPTPARAPSLARPHDSTGASWVLATPVSPGASHLPWTPAAPLAHPLVVATSPSGSEPSPVSLSSSALAAEFSPVLTDIGHGRVTVASPPTGDESLVEHSTPLFCVILVQDDGHGRRHMWLGSPVLR